MEYNTSRKKLILPEYGRNIQKLVEYAKTIEDKEERNKMAKSIINIMGNMYPTLEILQISSINYGIIYL